MHRKKTKKKTEAAGKIPVRHQQNGQNSTILGEKKKCYSTMKRYVALMQHHHNSRLVWRAYTQGKWMINAI